MEFELERRRESVGVTRGYEIHLLWLTGIMIFLIIILLIIIIGYLRKKGIWRTREKGGFSFFILGKKV